MKFKKAMKRKKLLIRLENEIFEKIDKKTLEDEKQALQNWERRGSLDYFSYTWSRPSTVRRVLIEYFNISVRYE